MKIIKRISDFIDFWMSSRPSPILRVHFFYRLLALAVDIVLLWLVMMVIHELLLLALPGIGKSVTLHKLLSLTIVTFYLLGEALTGFTPGKLILGIRAGSVEGKEGSIAFYMLRLVVKNTYLCAAVAYHWINLMLYYHGMPQISRRFGYSLMVLYLLVPFVVSCIVAISEHKQALHDMLLRSAVFYNKDLIKRIR